MNKYPLLAVVLLFFACNSNFEFDLDDRVNYTTDEDGDPVIDNIKDNKEVQDEYQFGLGGGYCYGYNTPQAEVADIATDIPMPPEYDISSFLPPVGSQGKQGSCVAWATGYYLKGFQENYEDYLNGNQNSNYRFSPAYIYNQIKISDCFAGSVIQTALDTITSQGVAEWNLMPYDQSDCETQPNDLQKTLAASNRIERYFYLDETQVFEQTKASLLMDQPVVIAVTIDRSYFGARDENGIYVYRKFKSADGGHAMLVVGYSDEMNAFKVVNSWGRGWGNEGFVWIDYKAFQEASDVNSDFKILCEAWVTEDFIINQPAAL
jgi:C1A family cysteine protease